MNHLSFDYTTGHDDADDDRDWVVFDDGRDDDDDLPEDIGADGVVGDEG